VSEPPRGASRGRFQFRLDGIGCRVAALVTQSFCMKREDSGYDFYGVIAREP